MISSKCFVLSSEGCMENYPILIGKTCKLVRIALKSLFPLKMGHYKIAAPLSKGRNSIVALNSFRYEYFYLYS